MDHSGASDDGEFSPEATDVSQYPLFGDVGCVTDSVENLNATYNVGGDMTQIQMISNCESGIDILHRYVVMEALHDSGEQYPEPVCHPGTRAEILQDLSSWSVDTNVEPMLWLRGSAGVGKSAIAQKFAGDCNSGGQFGAGFFFKRGHPMRGTWSGLIATIAYQLSTAVPEFLMPLQQAIETDKLVIGRSIPIQFQRLVLEPFSSISSPGFTPVVVLDGLDECANHKHQQQILWLFAKAINDGQLPIRLLIASRPEPYLKEVLEDQMVSPLCRQKELTADWSAYKDIEIFIRDEFSRIRFEFQSRGVDLGEAWPASDTLKHLVKKSSGIFIYATTVIRFLDDEYSHPADRLASVVALDPDSTAPLDDLYTQILSVLPQRPGQLRILHAILHPTRRLKLVLEDIDMALGLSRGTSRLMLRALHSLLKVPPLQTPLVEEEFVEPLHASFMDYLCDVRRSAKWCIEDPSLHVDLLGGIIRFLSDPAFTHRKWLRRSVVNELSERLQDVTPSDDLIGLLRNTHFQESIFIDAHREHERPKWPKRGSLYPNDLIQLWEDRTWITDLAFQLCGCRKLENIRPAFIFDSIYAKIFSEHRDVLLLVRSLILDQHIPRFTGKRARMITYPLPPSPLWDIPQVSFSALKPFLVLRDHGYSCYQKGDTALDFLQDPRRAGSLYSPPEQILEQWMLLWVRFAKQPLDPSGEMLDSIRFGLNLFEDCAISQEILNELESLDLATSCRQANIDRATHRALHAQYFHPNYFRDVLKWLSKFPKPLAAKAITFWEKQMADTILCSTLCEEFSKR